MNGRAFAAIDATSSIYRDHAEAAYGKLRAYGLGINQISYTKVDIQRHDAHSNSNGTYYWDPLCGPSLQAEWKERITHVDYVGMNDTLPYIGRQDGFYKGFYSRYVEIADSIKDNLMNVEVTISKYEQEPDNGDTTGHKVVQTRTITIPYDQIILDDNTTLSTDDKQILNQRVLFRYEQNDLNGSLYG